MGYICILCGESWSSDHVCKLQLELGPNVLVTNSRAEAQATFDAVSRELAAEAELLTSIDDPRFAPRDWRTGRKL